MTTTLPAVDFDKMRGKMVTLDTLREKLSATEPLDQSSFPLGDYIRFDIHPGWEQSIDPEAPVDCYMDGPSGQKFRLTKTTVLEAGSYAGLTKLYQQRCPTGMFKEQLDYWFSGQGGAACTVPGEVKVLARAPHEGEGDHPIALGLTRGTIVPFSNLALLDAMLGGIEKAYGQGEVLADYKFNHNLERTDFRLVVPGHTRNIAGTRVADDTWCTGLSLRNSITGLKQPRLDGYLFRWWCTNGSIDTLATAGALARRSVATPEEAYEWARHSVDSVLGGLEHSLDAVQELAGAVVVNNSTPEGAHRLRTVLDDLFQMYAIPTASRELITANIAELGGDITLYDIMNAITVTANVGGEALSPRSVEQIMTLGGHIAHAASSRCHECYRLMPEGWEEAAVALAGQN
jgi:hypothetical protein